MVFIISDSLHQSSLQLGGVWYIDIDISNNPVCRIFSTHIFHITRLSFLDVLPCQAFYDYRFSNIKVGKPNSGVWHFTGEKLIRVEVKKEKWWNFHLIKVSFSIIFINFLKISLLNTFNQSCSKYGPDAKKNYFVFSIIDFFSS